MSEADRKRIEMAAKLRNWAFYLQAVIDKRLLKDLEDAAKILEGRDAETGGQLPRSGG